MVLLDGGLDALTELTGVSLVIDVVGQSELAAVDPAHGIDIGEVRLHPWDQRTEVTGQGTAFRRDCGDVDVLLRDPWGSLSDPGGASRHRRCRAQLGGGGR